MAVSGCTSLVVVIVVVVVVFVDVVVVVVVLRQVQDRSAASCIEEIFRRGKKLSHNSFPISYSLASVITAGHMFSQIEGFVYSDQ